MVKIGIQEILKFIIKLRQTTEEVMMMRTKYTQSARELAIRAYKVNIFFYFHGTVLNIEHKLGIFLLTLRCNCIPWNI